MWFYRDALYVGDGVLVRMRYGEIIMDVRQQGRMYLSFPPFLNSFLPEKHKVHAYEIAILSVYPKCKTLKHLTDFNKTWQERRGTGGQPSSSIYSFLLTEIVTWRTREPVRQDRH